VITLILWLLGPTMAGWPLMLRTLLISVLMVNALTWIVLPALTRLLRGWLLAATPARAGARRPPWSLRTRPATVDRVQG
jgi:antibiotic biosynthesis monooxygenase (ABM) superfamily enzyme